MKYLYQLRRFFFFQYIKKSVPLKEYALVNWDTVKHVSILLPDCSEKTITEIDEAVRFLNKENRTTKVLVFNDDIKKTCNLPSFNSKEISWNFLPKSTAVHQFLQDKSDVLFAFFPYENLPLEYIILQSKTTCRIGFFAEAKTHYFELMIHPTADKSQSLKDLIEQSIEYLKKTE